MRRVLSHAQSRELKALGDRQKSSLLDSLFLDCLTNEVEHAKDTLAVSSSSEDTDLDPVRFCEGHEKHGVGPVEGWIRGWREKNEGPEEVAFDLEGAQTIAGDRREHDQVDLFEESVRRADDSWIRVEGPHVEAKLHGRPRCQDVLGSVRTLYDEVGLEQLTVKHLLLAGGEVQLVFTAEGRHDTSGDDDE